MVVILPLGGMVMDRLAAINVFVAIAEAGSLSAAGRRLGMPLSTVSRYLAAHAKRLSRAAAANISG